MKAKFKTEDYVIFNGKEYEISCVMENEYANWLYGLKPRGYYDLNDMPTIYLDMVEDFHKENQLQQQKLF